AGIWDVARRARTEFVRTPKERGVGLVAGSHRKWLKAGGGIAAMEFVLGAVGGVGLAAALGRGMFEAIVPTLALAAPNLGSFAASVGEIRRERVARVRSSVA